MKTVKISFTEHFLNNFNGSQEELDAIIEDLKSQFADGKFEEFFEGNQTENDELFQDSRTLH
jgi:hypothetical protein